jgi:hypothetical protein
MSSVSDVSIAPPASVAASRTGLWVIKRALVGLVIMLLTIGTFACLLYASIEPDRAEANPSVLVGGPDTNAVAEPLSR